MTTIFDHGVHGGIIYSTIPALAGDTTSTIVLFIFGFLLGIRADIPKWYVGAHDMAAGEPHELWFDPELGHLEFHERRPAEFERRIAAFFDQYLLNP